MLKTKTFRLMACIMYS